MLFVTEKIMIDLTKPVQTKSGLPVTILTTVRQAPNPIVGLITYPDGYQEVATWTADGKSSMAPRFIGPDNDLVNMPGKQKLDFWVNIYPAFSMDHATVEHLNWPTKQDADHFARENRIACLHIEQMFSDGEGL